MVEVVPRKTEIRIRVRGCLLLLLALLILALATLWAVTGTRWGASNPYSESLNSYFGRIYRFTPKTKPQDDLPAALRLHALESVGSDRYALLFSATDRDRNALTVIPAAAVSLSVANDVGSGPMRPIGSVQITPLHQMTWTDRVSLAAIMDYSGSMFQQDLTAVERNYDAFFKALVIPDRRSAVIKFDHRIQVMQALTNVDQEVLGGIAAPFAGGGFTALYAAIDQGLEQVKARPHLRALLLTTDGNNNQPPTLDEVLVRCRAHQVSAFVLGFGYLDVGVLQQLSEATDGYYVYLPSSDAVSEWLPKFGRILNNVQVLTFAATGVRRVKLEVTTAAGTLSRTRVF